MAERIQRWFSGLLCMLIIPVSPGTVYVQSGSDITDCNMKCPYKEGKMELYRQCGEEGKTVIEHYMHSNNTNYHDPRLRLHTGSGCWKLTHARKEDSCVYKVWCHCDKNSLLSSTEIRVLDPVLISNITSNGSRLGEDMAVSVQFSGEESAVTWEVDGEPLPERYRLIDDNRTLIIPSVQRDDADRRFRVRITNPVSEEIREYRPINDIMFIRMLEAEDLKPYRGRMGLIAALIVLGAVIVSSICQRPRRKREESNVTLQTEPPNDMERGAVITQENEPLPPEWGWAHYTEWICSHCRIWTGSQPSKSKYLADQKRMQSMKV